jgi:hypothetical protein
MPKAKALTALLTRSALGVKFWDGAGISFKHFFQGKQCWLNSLAFFWNRRLSLRLVCMKYTGDFADAQGLKWYVGPGAHVGFYDYYDHHNNHIDGTYYRY